MSFICFWLIMSVFAAAATYVAAWAFALEIKNAFLSPRSRSNRSSSVVGE